MDPLFLAPSVVYLPSLAQLPDGNLNVTIHHAFGLLSSGAEELFGLDAPANIRFGVDYGVTDRISVGVGRSRFDKVYDFRTKVALLKQTEDGGMPVSVSASADLGVTTLKNGYELSDRLNWSAMLLVGRRFTNQISVQVVPMIARFNRLDAEFANDGSLLAAEETHLAVGLAARYAITEVMTVAAEYIPVIGDRTGGTKDAVSLSLNLDTGGHVFQMFVTTSQWMTPQHVVSRNRDAFQDGDLRYGFNINRVFRLGS